MKIALVFGSTGLVGNQLVNLLIESPNYGKVKLFVRSPVKFDNSKIEVILKFFSPEYLKIFISLLLKSLIKKNWVEIKKIKGNISKITEGVFSNDR